MVCVCVSVRLVLPVKVLSPSSRTETGDVGEEEEEEGVALRGGMLAEEGTALGEDEEDSGESGMSGKRALERVVVAEKDNVVEMTAVDGEVVEEEKSGKSVDSEPEPKKTSGVEDNGSKWVKDEESGEPMGGWVVSGESDLVRSLEEKENEAAMWAKRSTENGHGLVEQGTPSRGKEAPEFVKAVMTAQLDEE